MMKWKVFPATGLLALLVACSGSDYQPQSNATASAGSEAAADDVGLRCKRVQVTGTRVSQKVCTTAAQREAQAQAAKEAVQQIQHGSTHTPAAAGG